MPRRNEPALLPRLDTRWDTVAGYRMFSRVCVGQRRPGNTPFVLVHGLSMSSRYMVPTARRLARDSAVYAPDLPGYGESQKPHRTLDILELAAVLHQWLLALEVGPAVLVGNSMGCQVIAEYALLYHERVLAAVLIGPTMDPSATRLPKLFARAVMNMVFEPVSFYPVLIHDYLKAGVHETFQALENAIRDPIAQKLRRVQIPVLVLRGSHDWLVTQPWAEQVTRLLPEGQFSLIQGGAHVSNYDAADAVVDQIRRFLARVNK